MISGTGIMPFCLLCGNGLPEPKPPTGILVAFQALHFAEYPFAIRSVSGSAFT